MSLSKKKDQITALYLKGSKLLIGSETGQVLSMNVDEPSNVCEIFRNPRVCPSHRYTILDIKMDQRKLLLLHKILYNLRMEMK